MSIKISKRGAWVLCDKIRPRPFKKLVSGRITRRKEKKIAPKSIQTSLAHEMSEQAHWDIAIPCDVILTLDYEPDYTIFLFLICAFWIYSNGKLLRSSTYICWKQDKGKNQCWIYPKIDMRYITKCFDVIKKYYLFLVASLDKLINCIFIFFKTKPWVHTLPYF